jgi:hypothetical protein
MNTEQLEREGWKFRTETTEARLQELLQEYQSLGFEVHPQKIALEVIPNEDVGCGSHCGVTCTACWDDPGGPSYRIYVRQKADQS